MVMLTKLSPAPDASYRAFLGHTTTCVACRSAPRPCLTAVELGRAWREARRGV